jgi:PAS domain S-box-containing protein
MRNGRFLYANPHALDLLGFETPKQISELPAEELVAVQDRAIAQERVRRCESGQGNAPTEIHVLHRDGSQRVMATVSVPIRMEDGQAALVVGVDISERKRAEERIRLEVERLHSLVEIGQHYPDSVQELLEYTLEKALILTRSRYGCIYLYSEERAELTLNTYSRQTKADCRLGDPQAILRLDEVGLLGEAVRQRRPLAINDYQVSNPLKKGCPAGHVTISRLLTVPVFSSGRLVAVVGVANKAEPYEETDMLQLSLLMDSAWKMVERRQAEEALLESRRDLALAQAVARIGSWRLSLPEGDMLGSEEAYRIFALPVTTPMKWLSFLGTVHPEDREMVDARWRAVLRGEPSSGTEHRILAGGAVKWVRSQAQVELDAEGRPKGGFGTVQDITERKRLEAQFLQAQKMDAVGRLAGGMAHDLNNLLTVIGGNAEIALAGLDARQVPAGELEEIKQAVKRAAELIRKLLAFSRRAIVERRVVDLNAVLSEMELMLRRLIGEHIELVTRMADDLPAVRIDSTQAEQVLTNLVVNARDAMPEGGRLTLETAAVTVDETYRATCPDVATGRYLLLSVSDTGCGMSEEVRAHLFEPFFTTKEVGRGTGLGLSTCYGIVNQNGGFIRVFSRQGQGTTVQVYLPAVAEEAESKSKLSQAVLVGGSEMILLAEDEAGIRRIVEQVLSSQGYQVLAARDGAQALELVGQLEKPPDLLVTDVVMPGMGGRELAERLVALHPALKVLYISGYTEDIIADRGTLKGDDLLSKPFGAATLVAKVREVLDR